jgi:hypothetical protein
LPCLPAYPLGIFFPRELLSSICGHPEWNPTPAPSEKMPESFLEILPFRSDAEVILPAVWFLYGTPWQTIEVLLATLLGMNT